MEKLQREIGEIQVKLSEDRKQEQGTHRLCAHECACMQLTQMSEYLRRNV